MKSLIGSSILLICAASWVYGRAQEANTHAAPLPTPTPQSPLDKGKKNSRPEALERTTKERPGAEDQQPWKPVYYYEFVRPGFVYGQVAIEHDEDGRGKIVFQKDGSDEVITDPVILSSVTLAKIKQLLTDLDFLNSTENYQHERDFSNIGNVTFTVRKDGRERTVKYNWTGNKFAKELMDEYRRIANEYTWLFEFNVARVNQPLRTPAMMDGLDGFLRRNEIPHPPHLLGFLSEISMDEKLPLITRNHAAKLMKQIEKASK